MGTTQVIIWVGVIEVSDQGLGARMRESENPGFKNEHHGYRSGMSRAGSRFGSARMARGAGVRHAAIAIATTTVIQGTRVSTSCGPNGLNSTNWRPTDP
jgi:hypothetical protein